MAGRDVITACSRKPARAMLPRTEKTRPKISRPVKATPIVLVPTMSVADAYAAIVTASLAHLEANEAGVFSGIHPKFLHQSRVALRRLRSAISVFRDINDAAQTASEMRWVAGHLGAARDWDVFVLETLPQAANAFPGMDGIREIRQHGMRRRKTAWSKAQRLVAGKRYQALKLDLRRCALAAAARGENPTTHDLRSYASRVLQRRYRKACKRGLELDAQGWQELHALRIAVKKLRYPVEFFSSLFDSASGAHFGSRLTAVQEILGRINDGVTAQRMLGSAVPSDRPQAVRAAAMVAAWAESRARALRADLDVAWNAFHAARVFW
jgi:CHAD domain-containing protein